LKACVIQNFTNAGGLQRVGIAVIESLNQLGFEVHLCSLSPLNKDIIKCSFGKELQVSGFKIPRLVSGIPECDLLRSIFVNVKPAVDADLYINTMAYSFPFIKPDKEGSLIMYLGRVPALPIDSDRKDIHYLKKTFGRMLNPLVIKRLDKILERTGIIATSNYVRNSLLDRWKVNAEVIYPPVDVDQYKCTIEDILRKDVKSIALVGRFEPFKRFETGILVAEKIDDCELHILGGRENDTYLEFIKSIIRESSASGRIKLYMQAPLEERAIVLRGCGVYLHPARDEDFGISIVEAMAAGCIPIVHNSGGPREFVPEKWRYDSFEECLTKVREALRASLEERLSMIRMAEKFHESYFKEALTRFINKYLVSPEMIK